MDRKFELNIVRDCFDTSLRDEDDVNLDPYLKSFEELNKFFTLLGTLFSFVSKDLEAKVETLLEFLKNNELQDYFKTVNRMIEYERDQKLLHKKGYTSGSRTLLRLHRALDFIRLFLSRLSELKDNDNTGPVCKSAYDETLAHHHTFVIRSAAKLAMYALPTKTQLLHRVCGNDEDIKAALEIMPETMEIVTKVYDRVEQLYTKHNLHSLP